MVAPLEATGNLVVEDTSTPSALEDGASEHSDSPEDAIELDKTCRVQNEEGALVALDVVHEAASIVWFAQPRQKKAHISSVRHR